MPEFQYVARELSGRQIVGTLSAQSEREALQSLAAKSLFTVKIAPVQSTQVEQRLASRRVPPRMLATLFSQMSDLLRAGVPLLRSIELLERQTKNQALKRVLEDVRSRVADGGRLADSMKEHPNAFNKLTVSIVHAGEEGGFLEDSLSRVAVFTEHQEELKSKVVAAMSYPLVLMVLGTIVVVGMIVFFVPGFEPMFDSMKQTGSLPWATTVLLAISNILQRWWWAVLLAIGAAIAGVQYGLATPEGQILLDKVKLRAPGIGYVTRSLGISRFCRVLGTLLHNGVPLLQALNIAKDATGNRVLSDAIAKAAENVSSGKTLAQPLAASKQFPTDVLEMIAVGEEANNLENVLIGVADKMEKATNRQLDLVVRLLEPLMLVVMAGAILFLLIALMLPIFQSSGVV
ncbi:type II secretion system protein [Planctopirus limnophila DSM 3776]|uniref:General secretion pathway protein F n=2 Tax=Planctopirus TaxID=1649480 RepID=D5SN81_PLAL2|nr:MULTISPECIES: type II secretion system F family protein [Planctopirus]ADG66008.1 type II secretion system protein [Planctopirus limnophila DSM 3776]QDV29052.1 Type II secretion system protein F [Planctopirus ephydatiae]